MVEIEVIILQWLATNWLAAYGAIIGTLAFVLNFARYRHSITEKRISLKVEICKHSNYDENISRLNTPDSGFGDKPTIVEAYIVTVRNIGSVDAYLQSAGLIDENDVRREALTYRPGSQHRILYPLSQVPDEPIKAKSSKKFNVFLGENEKEFVARIGFAEDKTGRVWKSPRYRARS